MQQHLVWREEIHNVFSSADAVEEIKRCLFVDAVGISPAMVQGCNDGGSEVIADAHLFVGTPRSFSVSASSRFKSNVAGKFTVGKVRMHSAARTSDSSLQCSEEVHAFDCRADRTLQLQVLH